MQMYGDSRYTSRLYKLVISSLMTLITLVAALAPAQQLTQYHPDQGGEHPAPAGAHPSSEPHLPPEHLPSTPPPKDVHSASSHVTAETPSQRSPREQHLAPAQHSPASTRSSSSAGNTSPRSFSDHHPPDASLSAHSPQVRLTASFVHDCQHHCKKSLIQNSDDVCWKSMYSCRFFASLA